MFLQYSAFPLNNADHFQPKALTCPEEKMDGDKPWCLPGYYDYLEPPMKEDEKMELDFVFTIEEIRDVDDERETIQIEIYLERQWKDERIQINQKNPHWSRTGNLPLSLDILNHIWKPLIKIQNLVDFKKHKVIEDLAGLIINKDKIIKHILQLI